MKPNRIFLLRHGESEGNVDKSIYSKKPDYALNLTELGKTQAYNAGVELYRRIKDSSCAVYYSPFFRTIQTLNHLVSAIPKHVFNKKFVKEDFRLREQEWHGKLPVDGFRQEEEDARNEYGHFYYRFEGGESGADVALRQCSFLDTLYRDFEKEDFPENALIVTHGMSMRLLLMKWLHLTVENFEKLKNPKNCQFVVLNKLENGKYFPETALEEHVVNHKNQCKLTIFDEQ